MSTPSDLDIIKKKLKSLIAENNLKEVFSELDLIVSDSSGLDNKFISLQGEYTQANSNGLNGLIDPEVLQRSFNRIRTALLEFIDELDLKDIKQQEPSVTSAPPEPTKQEGFVAYHIPTSMQKDKITECAIRISWDADELKELLSEGEDSEPEQLQVSEYMLAGLYDKTGEEAFKITNVNDEEQIIEPGEVTEWFFNVKPLKEGEFPLHLVVSIIQTVKGKERKRQETFKQQVLVKTTPVENTEGLAKEQQEIAYRAGFMFGFGPVAGLPLQEQPEEQVKTKEPETPKRLNPAKIGAAVLAVAAVVTAGVLLTRQSSEPIPDPQQDQEEIQQIEAATAELEKIIATVGTIEDSLDAIILAADQEIADLDAILNAPDPVPPPPPPPPPSKDIDVKDDANNTYKALELADGNIWLVENLRYDVGAGSWCYDDASSCTIYGRLYDYGAAEKACQALQGGNWQLPTEEQWRKLIESYGSGQAAYRALVDGGRRSFGAKLAGYSTATKADTPDYSGKDSQGHYWSGSNKTSIIFWKRNNSIDFLQRAESFGLSCRCIKVK